MAKQYTVNINNKGANFMNDISKSKVVAICSFVACIILAVIIGPALYENVKMGTFQITQNPFTGNIAARMQPGPYFQGFKIVHEFPVSQTFYFTSDHEGGAGDWSIDVQFNDGAKAKISGTCRADLPRNEKEALALIVDHGFKDWNDVEERLILPVVRKSLMMTANLMSSKESYSDKRIDFLCSAWDQIDKGVYLTKDIVQKVTDPISGQTITKTSKEAILDENGQKKREHNPLENSGIRLSNFEIKMFNYDDKIQTQIAEQQKALMDVQTARANALKAEQDTLTTKAQGEAAVMKARYEKEQEKIKAVTDAEKDVEVAKQIKQQSIVTAEKEREVASINLEKAKLEKDTRISLAQGDAEARRLVLEADGALTLKLEAYKSVNNRWAEAYEKRNVPSIVFGGNSDQINNDTSSFMQMLNAKVAKDLAVDLGIKATDKK